MTTPRHFVKHLRLHLHRIEIEVGVLVDGTGYVFSNQAAPRRQTLARCRPSPNTDPPPLWSPPREVELPPHASTVCGIVGSIVLHFDLSANAAKISRADLPKVPYRCAYRAGPVPRKGRLTAFAPLAT